MNTLQRKKDVIETRQRMLRYWIPPLFWAVLIFVISAQAGPDCPPLFWFPYADKLAHAGVFAFLSLLLFRAMIIERHAGLWTAALFAFVLSALYGAADEWHQSFVPSRCVELADWIADALGGAIAFPLAAWVQRRSSRILS